MRQDLAYCINMHKEGTPERLDASPWGAIKAGLAERLANKAAGPKPVVLPVPRGFRYQLHWETGKGLPVPATGQAKRAAEKAQPQNASETETLA